MMCEFSPCIRAVSLRWGTRHSPPFQGGVFATFKMSSRSHLVRERTGWL